MTVLVGLAFGLIAAVAIGFAVVLMRRWRAEQAETVRIRATFSRYVAPAIVDELLNRKDEDLFSGREVRATILVCRIWNFSQFIEELSPEETLRYLNEFYALAGTSIQKQRGVLQSFLGDGVVGVFGVPIDDQFQEDHALRAAINIVRLVAVMHDKWVAQNRRPLRVGIGINSGMVIAGDAGFANRREYTVVGPEAALAHRLQQATLELNAYIVASHATVEPVRELYTLLPVKGIPLNGVRRLLDASIVRGRRAGENLQMPVAAAFQTTQLDEALSGLPPEVPVPPTPPFLPQSGTASEQQTPRPSPEPPEGDPLPWIDLPDSKQPLRPRPRRRPADNGATRPAPSNGSAAASPAPLSGGFDLPELRMPSFHGTDEEAILPEPPGPRSTYEDNDGPPLPL